MKNIFTVCMLLAYPVLSYSQAKLIAPIAAGADQFGSIISMIPGATDFSSQLNFRGYSGGVPRRLKLLQASNGKLYGLTSRGGSNFGGGPGSGMGILFEYDLATGTYINKLNFLGDNGALPYGSLIEASNGKLYGMTSEGGANNLGVIFEYDFNTGIYTKKIDMTMAIGSRPLGSFVEAAPGKLLANVTTGATAGPGPGTGGIIEYDFNTNSYTTKIVFVAATGITSEGDLVKATGNGKYYGLTRAGGATNVGVLFEYDYTNNIYIKKTDLTAATGNTPTGSLVNAPNGKLYGLTNAGANGDHVGSVFEYNYVTNNFTKKKDLSDAIGGRPYGSLVLAGNGKFYGLCSRGGADIYKSGALFEYDYVANVYTKKIDLYDSTGTSPEGTLIQLANGKLYGTTTSGAALYSGVLFEYDITANSYTKKFTFGISEGKDCAAPMMKAANGLLYGTTFSGGPRGIGSIYSYDPVANTYADLYDCGNEGAFPTTTMVEASPGKLYGIMSGEIFEFDYLSNTYTRKFQFIANQGYDGRGDLLKAANGKLYGTTFYGGADEDLPPLENYAAGVIFEYEPGTNSYTKKYDLNEHVNHDGMSPYSGLVEVGPGILYGTTTTGGLNGNGVIFEYNYLTNTYTKKFDFLDAVSGSSPAGKLMLAANGQLFGATTTGGTFGAGTLFKYDFNTNVFTKQHDFNGTTDGATPTGFLLQSSNGKIYGLTHTGGDNNVGVVFEYNYTDSVYTVKKSFSPSTGDYPRAGFIELNNASCVDASQPVLSAGSNTICAAQPVTLSIQSGNLNDAVEWKWYANSCGGTSIGSGTSISVSPSVTTTYYARGEGGCAAAGSCGTVLITVSTLVQSVSINANTATTICAGTTVTFTASPTNGGITPVFQWKKNNLNTGTNSNVYTDATLNTGDIISCVLTSSEACVTTPTATSNSLVFTVNNSSTASTNVSLCPAALPYEWNNNSYTQAGIYQVLLTNSAGCDSIDILNLTVNTAPVAAIINNSGGTELNCLLTAVSVTATGGVSYAWDNGLGNTANASINSAGTYIVTVTSANGCTAQAGIVVTQNLNGPAAPVMITGPTNVCPFIATGDQITYTASPVTGATSYEWSVPPAVSIVSGQGTASLTITFAAGFATAVNKQLRVRAIASCGTSVYTIKYLAVQFPSTPQAITGPADACAYLDHVTEAIYSIPPATAATAYHWTVPAAVTITENNGTNIKVIFNNNFVTSIISVVALNNCGTSSARNITVKRVLPAAPGLITGPTNSCMFMPSVANPAGTTATYSIAKAAGITSYNWTVPAGTTIVQQTSTATTDAIEVSFSAAYSTGGISVVANNNCGTSAARTLNLSRIGPGAPGLITALQIQSCPLVQYQYSVPAIPSNATGIEWSVPAGASILSGQGTATILVSYSSAANGTVTAKGNNGCGSTGTFRSYTVLLPACSPAITSHQSKGVANSKESKETTKLNIYPNPSSTDFRLQLATAAYGSIKMNILDMQGRMLKQVDIHTNTNFSFGDDLKPGSYLVEITNGRKKTIQKIIKL